MINHPNHGLNSRGVSLMEVMVTIVILSIISVGLMTFLDNSISTQNFVTFKAEADALTNEIRTTLGDPTACRATFNSATPGSLQVDTSMASVRSEIRSKTNSMLYATSSTYGDRALTLSTISIGQYTDGASTEGLAILTLVYTATRKTAGPSTIARTIPIVTQKATTSLTNCYSKAAGSDSLWMAVGTTSVTAIYFASGPVGIGTPTPNDLLTVMGSGNSRIRLNSTTGGTQFVQYPNTGQAGYFDNGTLGSTTFIRTSNATVLDTANISLVPSGNVGIGTTAPNVNLQINSAAASTAAYTQYTNGTTGTTAGSGFYVGIDATNEYRVHGYGATPVKIFTNGAERLRVNALGQVAIGTTAPAATATLHVNGATTMNGSVDFLSGGVSNSAWIGVTNSVWGANYLHIGGYGSSPNRYIGMWANIVAINGGSVGIGTTAPSQALDVVGIVRATSFLSTSDRNEKENIETSPGLELIMNLRGVTFQWKKDHKPGMGVVAQEVEEFAPELVATDKVGKKSVYYEGLIGPLIESVKELNVMCKMSESQSAELAGRVVASENEIATLKLEVTLLKARLEDQEFRLRRLEKNEEN